MPQLANVPGTDQHYVDDAGSVYATVNGTCIPLRQSPNDDGYLTVRISERGVTREELVHRVVAEAFLGPPPFPDAVVNHRDTDKANNAALNLEYITRGGNVSHSGATGRHASGERHYKAKFTEQEVEAIRSDFLLLGNMELVAQRWGVHRSTISRILNRKTWRGRL